MKQQYTTAFLSIALSGEIFTIAQFQGTLIECAKWRKENKERYTDLFKEITTVTLKHR